VNDPKGYVLGQNERAARRLEIQDQHFGSASERLLDDLAIRPTDRVVELGCGAGSFSRRVLTRLGPSGVLVGVDTTPGLLEQAKTTTAGKGPGRFEPTPADITSLGPWLDGADVVLGRAVLHHVPMAELFIGRLRARLRAGARVGFIEPDFRSPLGRIAYLEATGQPELAPLRIWGTMMNQLYLSRRISPAVGATLGRTMETAGYRNVRSEWFECPTDALVIENMIMCYDEVRDVLQSLNILTTVEVDEQVRLLGGMSGKTLPAVWGAFRVTAET
jgi:ubiquinone/menaquinone biosynthesis C-methylase UbiE